MGHPSEGLGSWSHEAAKLFAALTETAGEQAGEQSGEPAGEPGDRAEADADGADGANGADCGFCPLCRAKRALDRPEVREPLAAAASSLLQALSAVLSTPVPDAEDRRDSPTTTDQNEDL